MRNEGDAGEMKHVSGTHITYDLRHIRQIRKVGLVGLVDSLNFPIRFVNDPVDLVSAFREEPRQMAAREARDTGDESACHGVSRLKCSSDQKEKPALLRRRSASTIIRHSSSNLVSGFHPSFSVAFAGSPMRRSTSAGR